MLVDDSKIILSLIKEIINTDVIYDTEVITFSDAGLAKEQFLQINPDFVITDIEMPVFDGFQLIEYIKSVSTTTILAMSGSEFKNNNTETILFCARAIGADYGILKGDISEQLSLLVTEIIITDCVNSVSSECIED